MCQFSGFYVEKKKLNATDNASIILTYIGE